MASLESLKPWWARKVPSDMKRFVCLLDQAGGRLPLAELRGQVHAGIFRSAERRGLVERQGDLFTLTERGQLVARGSVPLIPEEHRAACACGFVVDGRDTAQLEYLLAHKEGRTELRRCPLLT